MSVRILAILVLGLAVCAGSAVAGPCNAPAPAVGAEIHGPVLHVLDGRRLCVALGETPDRWVELSLNDAGLVQAADVADPNPRGTLMAMAFAQNVTCKVTGFEAGRAVAPAPWTAGRWPTPRAGARRSGSANSGARPSAARHAFRGMSG